MQQLPFDNRCSTIQFSQCLLHHRDITNIKFQGIKALQHPKYEDLKIKQFRQKYKGKNIRLQVISHHHVQQQEEGVDKCKNRGF
jgi:hypothetical protein